jgi:ABC-2 type transport system permease protein
MMNDILTVMWKETRSLVRNRSMRSRFLFTLLSPLLFALLFPWKMGADWVDSPMPLMVCALISLATVAMLVPDTFAGERERHTLETLLASRLPDRAILLGKLAVSITLAWGLSMLALILSLGTTNVFAWGSGLILYTPATGLGSLALSLLLAILTAGIGVLVSQRAATVQQATQTLVATFMLPAVLLQFTFLLFNEQVAGLIRGINGQQVLLIGLAVLAAIDGVLLTLVLLRFRRSRLLVGL